MSPAALSRRESSAVTRSRLVSSAIEILRADGAGGATTGRIARGAGLKQASFYAHFRDRDACLEAAASQIGETLLSSLEAALIPLDASDLRGSIRRIYASLLGAMLAERELARLFLAYRMDTGSSLGAGMRRDLDRARVYVIAAIGRYGVTTTPANAAAYAELLVAVMFGLVEAVLAGRVEPEVGLDAAAAVTYGALLALLTRTPEARP